MPEIVGERFMDFIIDIMDDISAYFIGKHINFVNSIFYYNEPSLSARYLHSCVDYKQENEGGKASGALVWVLRLLYTYFPLPLRASFVCFASY